MADATEVRSDSTPTPTETPAAAAPITAAPPAEAVPAAAMTATAEPAAAVMADAPDMAKAADAPAIVEAPAIAITPPADRPAAPASPAYVTWMGKFRTGMASAIPLSRSAALAGGVGFVAGAGLLVGIMGVMGVGHLFAASKPAGTSVPWSSVANETRALKETVSKLEAQVTGLKTSIETSNRHATTQRAQITNRYDQNARTQTEMQTRIGKIGDAVERLEKRVTAVVAAEATGSVAPRYAAAAAGAQPATGPQPATGAPPQTLGTPPQPLGTLVETQAQPTLPKPPIVEGWTIRDVFRGRALVSSRRGVFEAAPGVNLPELGRVEAVTRQSGRWVVVTEKGIITAAARRPGPGYGFAN
jgi:hypothetical protein